MSRRLPWFRFYTEALDDPKVQRLPPHLFKTWVNLLCLAGLNAGIIPSVADVAFHLRLSTHDAQQQLDELTLCGLIDVVRSMKRDETQMKRSPHNWNARQFKSDTSTERVKMYRKKRSLKNCNGDETFHGTAPDTDTDSEAETEVRKNRSKNLSHFTTEYDAEKKRSGTDDFIDLKVGGRFARSSS